MRHIPFILLILALNFIACELVKKSPDIYPDPKKEKEQEIDSIAKVAGTLSWKNSEWDKALYKELVILEPLFSKAKDITTFCPKYNDLTPDQKLHALGEFMVAIAFYESGFNPSSKYMEPPPLGYESIGLYQLSYEDNKGYPDCKLNRASKNLEDPAQNIRCASIIMQKLLKDGQITSADFKRGLARYWSVTRPTNKGKPRPAYNGIKNRVLEYAEKCK